MDTYLSIDKIKYPKSYNDKYFNELAYKLIEIEEILKFISNLPVIPSSAEEIKKEEKIKAIRGTTGIEGNVLDEAEIRAVLEKHNSVTLTELEVINSGKVHDFLISWSKAHEGEGISESLIKQIHKYNTEGLHYVSNIPGDYRNFEVTYGYPPKKTPLKTKSDIEIEMRKLVAWVNDSSLFTFPFSPWIVKGILTHYWISRIHPFSDGNGRTARAIEALIFYHFAKISDYCFYGIANYCYRNRDRYIQELAKVDLSGEAYEFLIFCTNGFYESINYVKDRITSVISELMFMDYVHYLRRDKKLSKKAVEVLDFLIKTKGISYTDYYKRFFNDRTEESKRRYLKKFESYNLIRYSEKNNEKIISPNLTVLQTLRRIV